MSTAPSVAELDVQLLRQQIRDVYREVADAPEAAFHFATGRAVAEHLGYPAAELAVVPEPVLASFAGVGYALDLAGLRPGQRVLDLGCGSGTDAFIAAQAVGAAGRVVGVDMTDGQLAKARAERDRRALSQLHLVAGYVEAPPVEDGSVDAVISNGVLNLVPDKARAFAAAARALRPGGRLAISDIVSARPIAERTRAQAGLWAACIAGAATRDDVVGTVERAGLRVVELRENPQYAFTSERALGAARRWGVASVSLLAVKPPAQDGEGLPMSAAPARP